jgi:predicted Fe-Mo cluster-binding NifX family protein
MAARLDFFKESEMKIAFATEDGKTVSAHFGKAPYYIVVQVSEGKVVAQEMRAKAYHGNHQEYGHNHADMFTCIADCQVLVVGGMGTPAHQAALAHGLKVIATGQRDIAAAIEAYLNGTLQENPLLIHVPGRH